MATATKKAQKGAKNSKTPAQTEAKEKGLGAPAIRILTALSKAKGKMTRAEICEKGTIDPAWAKKWLGFKDGREGTHDLVKPGYIKVEQQEIDGRDVLTYSITAKGRQALEKAVKGSK